jgi:signal transduction histidine kinase
VYPQSRGLKGNNMEDAITLGPTEGAGGGTALQRGLRQFWCSRRWSYVVCCALTTIFFAADLVLPRGATVAIGYCVVPAVAAGTRRRGLPFGMTIACTVLTWIAFFVEPGGYAGWKSAFDRAMVTGIVWFALLLVARRARVIRVLLHRTEVLKATTQELERSNGELASFASVVAHDLRGPLNSVGLAAQLLSSCDPVKADADCWDSIGTIRTELAQMTAFIQRLLTYGRAGSGAPRLEACDCAAVLRDVRQNLKADLERSRAEVENDPLPVVRADPVLIAQLFQNLVENSIKYRSAAPPRVHVSCSERPDCWLFSVRDNGIGIRSGDTEHIFEPFRQSGSGRRTRGGVGLGLATCKRIVERHGGSIDVRSRPGEGTTFLFTVQRASSAPKPANPPEAPE